MRPDVRLHESLRSVLNQPVAGLPAQWTMYILQGVGVSARNVKSRGKIQSETGLSSQILTTREVGTRQLRQGLESIFIVCVLLK